MSIVSVYEICRLTRSILDKMRSANIKHATFKLSTNKSHSFIEMVSGRGDAKLRVVRTFVGIILLICGEKPCLSRLIQNCAFGILELPWEAAEASLQQFLRNEESRGSQKEGMTIPSAMARSYNKYRPGLEKIVKAFLFVASYDTMARSSTG